MQHTNENCITEIDNSLFFFGYSIEKFDLFFGGSLFNSNGSLTTCGKFRLHILVEFLSDRIEEKCNDAKTEEDCGYDTRHQTVCHAQPTRFGKRGRPRSSRTPTG
jgi:hypothetical protein